MIIIIMSFIFTSVSVIEHIIGHTSERPLLEEVVLKCEGDSLSEREINNGNYTEWSAICIGNHTVSSSVWN